MQLIEFEPIKSVIKAFGSFLLKIDNFHFLAKTVPVLSFLAEMALHAILFPN